MLVPLGSSVMVDSPQFAPLSNPATAGICPSSVCRRSGHAYPDRTSDAVLDHVVLAARRREDIDEPLAALGLVPGSARSIPGTGPSNVVVAVGTQLLELHYPDASPVDEGSPPYARIQRQVLDAHPDTALIPVAWVVRFGSVTDVPPEPPNGAPYLLGGLGGRIRRTCPRGWSATRRANRSKGSLGSMSPARKNPEEEVRDWCEGMPADVRFESGRTGPLRVRVDRPEIQPAALGLPLG